MKYKVVIIGAGPAGLSAAAELGEVNAALLESQEGAGKKLLLSGSGQCNVTHTGDPRTFFEYYGPASRFVRTAISKYPPNDFREELQWMDVPTVEREDGKIFPRSMKAEDVLGAMVRRVDQAGVALKTGMKVTAVTHGEQGFLLQTSAGVVVCDKLVIACGGASFPMTGSDGSGFVLAEMLGHSIIPPRPALSPVYVQDHALGALSGIGLPDCQITIVKPDGKRLSANGDVLITHKGLSGPGILNYSRDMRAGDRLEMRLCEAGEAVRQALEQGGKKQVETVVGQFVPKRMAEVLCAWAGVPKHGKCAELRKEARKNLLKGLERFPAQIGAVGELKAAMATAGGVDLAEVNGKTMASRLVKGLYFAGEVLDVDGHTGGYNIQWAWSSGKLAAQMLRKELER